jgi:hypothetical protein
MEEGNPAPLAKRVLENPKAKTTKRHHLQNAKGIFGNRRLG